ncbi:MAG: hypothetical protein HYR56_14755 [Acidobacteria bacterium]|nr:hypothetical protein [Acidobacteriota bacterium]MBI3427942.1 hypothetical protein [Acidobacteriota bacterium]
MTKHPLAEVFGFPASNNSPEALRHRKKRLYCTKDKANDPLGVCSVFDGEAIAITCPVRIREDWLIADEAAAFFFPPDVQWTSLVEVQINDRHGKPAGNIDVVLMAYDERGRITDFGSLEIQAVHISGNVRAPVEHFLQGLDAEAVMDWANYPCPDYQLSLRKQLAWRLGFKGGIFHAWGKKQAVALHRSFYESLPPLPLVDREQADLAWLIYDLRLDAAKDRYKLCKAGTVYTKFEQVRQIIVPADSVFQRGGIDGYSLCWDQAD